MSSRPARSTLFPYTTLFRSGLGDRPAPDGAPAGVLARDSATVAHELTGMGEAPECPDFAHDGRGRHLLDPDRKSTRLNSSHANISYAVFCLKKKRQESVYIV